MRFEEYIRFDATGLAQEIRRGAAAIEDVERVALDAIEALNPLLNAVIEHWPGEHAAPPPEDAPFRGVPFLIKDIGIQRAGRRQEFGSRLAEGFVAGSSSFLMDCFDRLGFNTLGRTRTPEFGHAPTTEPLFGGATRNPWDLSRMAGGSSGGAAACVAAGVVPIAHANDGAGSIRIPAACCGLIGLKPSRGRVSSGPAIGEAMFGMGAELALTRSVRDTAAVLDGASRPMPGDPFVIRQPTKTYVSILEQPPVPLRIGYTTSAWYDAPIDAEIVTAVEAAAERCRALGHVVVEASPKFNYQVMREACITLFAASLASLAGFLALRTGRAVSEETLEAGTLAMVRHGETLAAGDVLAALAMANQVCRSVGPFFAEHDLLLTPSTAKVAQPLGAYDQNLAVNDPWDWFDRKAKFPPFLALFNLTGQPAISLPLAMSEGGLPIGIQFVSGFGREDVLLHLAAQLEREGAWAEALVANQSRLWAEATFTS